MLVLCMLEMSSTEEHVHEDPTLPNQVKIRKGVRAPDVPPG